MRTRRRVATVGAVLALCCVGGGIAVASTALAPWAESDRDAARSRYNNAETTLGPSNVAQVTYLRSFATPPAGPYGTCSSGPAQSILTAGKVFFAGDTGAYAYNAQTGALIWHKAISGADSTDFRDIAATGGRVFVGEDDCGSASDPNGYIQAFSASNGARLWGSDFVYFGTALQGLVVSGKYVVASGTSLGSGARVAVYNAATGAVVWSREMSNTCESEPAIVVRSRVIYQTCDDNGNLAMQAADLATGTVSWTKSGIWTALRGDSDAPTAHHLYAKGQHGAIVDINPATGATRFTLTGAQDVLAVGPVRVFASCDAGICSYLTATGAPSWTTWGGAPVALANGVLYTGFGQALNASTGAAIATIFGGAKQLLVGDGRIGVVSDPRAFDLYGLPGD